LNTLYTRLKFLVLTLICFLSLKVEGQFADFTTNPQHFNNTLNICGSSSVLFTVNTSSLGNNPSTLVQWTITTTSGSNTASVTTSTLKTPFPILFPQGQYSVTLTVTTPNNPTSTKTITVNSSAALSQTPSLSLNNANSPGWTTGVTTVSGNNTNTFTICPLNSDPQYIQWNLNGVTCSQISSISITDYTTSNAIDCSSGIIENTYNISPAVRFFYLVLNVGFTNGCNYSTVYFVQIGQPSVPITSSTVPACDPGNYALSFNNQAPGVTYTIDWDLNNPNNPTESYTYPNLPTFPSKVLHSYPFVSCSNGSAPSYDIQVTATNTCGFSTSQPADVYVSQAPDAIFNRTPNLDVICQGTQVTYTDNSFAGYYSNPNNGNCSQVYNRWWNHSNNTGSGPSVFPTTPNILLPSSVTSLGNSSTNGPQSFSVTYNQPGTYSIKLIVRSAACGNDTMTKTVCVVPAVQANFNPNLTTGCVPLTVLTTNNSSLPGCPGTNMLYNWSVSNAPSTCGTPAWSFATGFNSNSSAPSINFTGPGQYTIKLVTSLNPSVPGAQCQNDTLTQTITVKDKPIVNIPSPSPICQGQSFTPTATVNDCYNPSSTYAWSFTNGSPATSTILNPGSVSYTNSGNFTYTLIATNSCGPTSVSNTITVNPIAIVNAGVNDTVCQGSSVTLNGLVSGGATGGTWQSTPTGGSFLPNANTLNASYIPSLGTTGNVVLSLTATGTTSPCPSVSDDKIIVFNPKPTVSAGNDTTICAGSNVNLHGTIGGAATNSTWTTATPGSGSFSNANALNTTFTPSATAISAGGVDLILTTNDPVGPCGPTKDTVHVTINPIPSLTATNINTVCSGVTFNIPLTPSVLSPPASYAWNVNGTLPAGVTTTTSGTISPPNSSLIGTVSNLSAGPVTINYSITTTVNGCTSAPISVNATINPLPQPLITPPGPTTVCNGNTLTLTTSVYSTYLWSNNATTQSTTINSAGNYTVTVTNSYGCTGTSPASVVNFSEPIQPTFTQVNAICFNGTFSLPSTSTNGITGTWSPAINTSATTVYTFTPSPGQCANTAQMTVTVNALPTPTITANGPLTFCQGSSVILTATGGSSYVWNLNGSLIAGATSATYTATTAGSYSVTATNANGCQATSTVTIVTVNPNPQPVINPIGPTAICQGTNLILSTASTYSSYNWYLGSSPNSLGTNDSLTVNSAGSYTVTVVNSNGCSGTSNASVVSITSPTVPTFAPIAAVCQNSNFTLPNSSINGVSGTWSPAINNQSTTVYTFTPNLGQCASNTTLQVVINPLPTVTINAVTICSGQSATLNAIPSITGGTYSWSGSSQTTASLTTTPLVNTIYTVTYTLNNCSATDTALVQVKTTPTLSVNNATICNGQTATLTATASPLGGVYSWSNSSNSSTISVNPSSNGSYTVNYALNGCNATAAVSQVTVNPVPTISTNNPTICQGQSVALTASVNLSGGTYLWSNNASTATITVSPNTSTNYTVVYTLNNCSSLPANTNVTVTPSPTISSPNTSICSGQSTTLNTTVSPPGGTYQWSPSVGLSSNTASNPTASPNATQLYTVVYTANGCASLPDTVIVSVIQGITASVNNATICNGSTAVLTALPNNATYLWSNGATTSSISISPNSSTSLTVTVSAPGCPSSTATSAVTVNAIPTLTLPSSTTICNGASASIATTVSAPGGTYLWSPSAQTTATLNIAPALTNNSVVQNFNYTVVYTLNGCPSLPDTATITVNPLPTVSLPASTALCNGSSTTLTPTVNIPGGTYLWTNGETTSTISVNPTANANYGLTYSLNGCSSSTGTSSGNIVVNPIPTVSVNNQTICAGQQASLTAVGTPANQGTYLWSTTASTASINVTPTATGTYTVTYTVNNCPSVPAIANVTVNPIPTLNIPDTTICGGLSVALSANPTPTGGTYLWSANANNATTSQVTVTPAVTTTYSLAYTANGCVANDNVTVSVIQNPIATVANQTICFGSSTTLVAGPNGASYLWSNGATTQTLTVSPTVTTPYSVTVNIGGCAATTATSTVTVNPIPTVSIPNNATICNGATASLATSVSAPGGTYLWSPSAQTTATLNIAPALTNNAVVQNFNYTVVYTLNGCPSLPDTATITVNPVPTVSLPASTALCNGSSTTLTPTVNIPGGTYLWTNGETTSTISVNPTANANYGLTYSLNGCASSTGTSSGNIVVNPIPTVSVNNQTICAGQQASLTAVGTPANQGTYLWSTTESTASINVTPTATGTYTVTYTVNNCPSVPAIANVTVNPIPTLNIPDTTICGGLSVALSANPTPTGGTYLWSANANNATTSQITVSPTTTTTYTLVYTANNCSLSQDIQVQVIQNPIATVANQTICFGSSTTLVAGPNGASYLWSNGATTQTLTVSPTVTTPYSVTVNIGGCAATTATSTVTVNPIPTVSIPNNATICNGASASLATSVSAPGGTYLWSPSAQTTATLNIAPALTNNAAVQNFNYTVVYTLNGCPSLPDTATITVNPVPTVSLPTSTALCNGSSTTLTPTVNIPGGTYLWTNGETTSTISVNPTANANYGLTYSLNGCASSTGTSSGNIVVNPIPTVSVNNQTICAGQQASLTAVGTPANQGTYLWSTTASTASINVTPTATGTYTVTYTVNNCPSVPAIANVTVNPIPTLNIPDTTICGGLSVALSANPTPTGGTYLWSANANNATTSQVTVTPAVTTTYSLAYTANGCVANDNVTVSVIQNPIATVANQTICFGSSTTLVAGPNGASYLWSNGATTQTLTVSPTVTTPYSVTVNIGGCAATTATSTVTVNPIPTVSIPNNATICNGATASLATSVSAPGGTYLWSPSAQTTATLNIAPALTNNAVVQNFNYTVVYTLNGCPSLPDTATITVNPVPTVSLPASTALCNGSSTTLTPTVNIPGGTYLWTNGETTSTISVNPTANANYGLTYSLNGCASSTGTSSGNIVVNPIPTVSVNNQTICAGQQASLTAVGTPANQGTYLWSTTESTASINVTPTATGTYTVTYTVNNCPSVPAIANVTVNPIPTLNIPDTTICGGLSVALSANPTPTGGTYLWSANANNATTSQVTVTPAVTTTYSLAYTANGCVANDNVTVSVIQNPIATVANQTICFGSSTTLVAGPNGASYLWSTGATTQTLTVSPTVTTPYSVTVNIGGCAATTATSTVTVNPIPTVSIPNNATICNGATASLATSVSAPGGTYLWSPSAQTTATLNIAPALTNNAVVQNFNYTVVYTLNGCPSLPDTATITVNPVPTVSLPASTALCNGSSTTLTPTVNIPGGTYLWTNGETTSTISVNPTANANYGLTYSLNGCASSTGTSSGNIVVNPIPTVSVNNQTICAGQQASLTAVGTPANQGTYLWSTTESTASINVTPTATGTYTVTYTVNNCPSVPAIANVTVNPIPTLNIPDTTICGGLSVALSANPTPTGGTYLWSANANNATTSQVTVTPAVTTTYSLAYTANGCVANDNVTVSVIQNPIATVANQTICFGSSTTLVAGPNGASYLWSNGATTQTLTVSPTVTTPYSVTVNIGGCAATTATSTVTVNPIPSVSVANVAAICNGSTTTLTATPSAPGGAYVWNNGATGAIINVTPSLTNPTSAQNFNYSVIYTLNGCPSLPDTVTVSVNPVPTASLPTTTTICNGSSDTLVPTVNPTGGTFSWSNGATTSSIVVNPTANTNYSVTYTLNGCPTTSSSTTGFVVVNPIPTVTIPTPAAICFGQQATLTATPSALGGSYLWSANTNNATSASINVSPTSTTTYSVVYTLNGCASAPTSVTVTVNPIPVITINDTTICGGLSVLLNPSVTPTGGTFAWSANANNATTSQVTVTPANTTIYTLVYTANGCIGTENIQVSVIQNPIATVENDTICFGSSTTLVAGPNGASYLWSTGATTQTLTVSPTVTTPYSVTVNIGGCAATTATSTVTVNPIPTVSIPNNATICNGVTASLATSVSAPGGTYLWSPSAQTTATLNIAPALTNNAVGQNFNYTVIYTLNGCPSLPDTATITVNPVPIINFNDTTICETQTASLVGIPNILGGNYTWSTAQTTQQINVSPSITTSYSLIYTINGCSDTTDQFVYVNPIPTIQINQNPTICYGSDTLLTTNVSIPSGTYAWSGYGLTGVNNQNQVNVSPQNGNSNQNSQFIYSVIYSVNGCSDTAFTTVYVNLIPTITASASQSTICPGESTVLTGIGIPTTSNGNQGVYSWTTTNPITNIGNSPSVTVNPIINTTYEVVYTLNSCPSVAFPVSITIQPAPALVIQNNPNATICEGGCVTLTALQNASSIVPSGYIWSTGETTQSIIVCPTDTMFYSVIGLSGTCESLPDTTFVNVVQDPIITTQIVLDTNICVGGAYTFNISVSGGVGLPTYQWFQNSNPTNFGGTAIPNATNSAYTTPVFNVQGAYFYYCVITYPNGVGCNAISTEVGSLYVLPDPTISITNGASQTLCIGGDADCLSTEVLGGVGTNTYLWIPGGAVTDSLCPPSNQVGTINYSVIVQQSGIACGSLPSNQVSITVIPDPIINISGLTDVCEGAEVPLNTSVTGGIGSVADYQWYESNPTGQPYQIINGATSLNFTSPVLTSDASYVVEVNLTGVGCNDTDTFAINVYDDPLITIQGNLMACMNEQIDLTTVFTGGTPNSSNTYTWYSAINQNYPDSILLQSTSILNTYSFNIYQDTSIFVIVTNSGFNCDNDTSALINVNGIEWAEASFDMDPSDLSQSLLNPTFSFINTSLNSTNYFWDLGECDPQSPMSELFTPPTPFYDPTDKDQIGYTYGCPPGLYQIMMVAMNQGMCPDTAYQVIRIQDEILVYVPNTFTPDYDETNDFFFPVISTIIKPNTYYFSIYDRWGELIFESKDPNEKWDGTYYKNKLYQSGLITKQDEMAQDGTYNWKLRFTVKESGVDKEFSGHVNLLK
jgi:large repetitive protein